MFKTVLQLNLQNSGCNSICKTAGRGFHASGVWFEIFYCTLLVLGFSFLHINESTGIERYTLVQAECRLSTTPH